MLNQVALMGRITQDLQLRQTPNGVPVVTFTVAVDRNYVRHGEERQTDFIPCVAWRQTAEFICKHFAKGRMIAVTGKNRTRSYTDKNDVKRSVMEVFVDEVSFTGEKPAASVEEVPLPPEDTVPYADASSNNAAPDEDNGSVNGEANLHIGSLKDFEEAYTEADVPM